MVDGEVTVCCKQCGNVLDQSPSLPVEEREPCPECSSLRRRFGVYLEAKLKLRAHLGVKAKPRGRGKPFMTGKFGDELHRKTGKWYHRMMTVDRRNNRYRERIEDPETGAIVRDVDEPLDQHRGHGDAKK